MTIQYSQRQLAEAEAKIATIREKLKGPLTWTYSEPWATPCRKEWEDRLDYWQRRAECYRAEIAGEAEA